MADTADPQTCQMSQQSAIERLADYVTDLTGRANLQLWLYQNNISPSPTNTIGNFQECTFGGYARYTGVSFLTQGVNSTNSAYVSSLLHAYSCNGASPQNSVYGSILVGTPTGAVNATATAVGGSAGAYAGVTITAPGAAYQGAPKVTATGATGTGFAATAVINSAGQVTAIDVTNAGTGYTTYTLTLDPPLELIKQNVLSTTGISMALSTDLLVTYTELVEPSNAS